MRGACGRHAGATASTRRTTTNPMPRDASNHAASSFSAWRRARSPPSRGSGRGNQRFGALTLAAQRNGAIAHGPDQGHGLGGRLGGDADVAADADGGHRRGEGGHDEGHLATLCRRALLRMYGRGDLGFRSAFLVTSLYPQKCQSAGYMYVGVMECTFNNIFRNSVFST
jgi:hypothetical protein